MKIHCLQHVAFETPGTILEWAALHGHAMSYTNFFEESCSFPQMNEFDCLLIMGGYMNVDEEEKFPWLKAEKEFIKTAIESGKKVLGICLGSQLIASVLGALVYKGTEKEIGFFPIQFTATALNGTLFDHYSRDYTLFHWHGDTFDLPGGAELIASTPVCAHQAFIVGHNVLAMQFHPEMNESTIEQMVQHDGHELEEKGDFIQSVDNIQHNYKYLSQNKKDLFELLGKFFR